ncbi:non-structural polyprotein [Vesivirus ferret badger/JX12/China/2012]|uniref:non-structural polyprotein n=1 Tax=Vesivirus ferret badger/JX12/China/2012 TaxID=1615583 RepID=UPI00062AD112|nr:non-structural polyprotein [Vesivirus ferret badger/JX12/China/2012]AJO15926.1 non-structural polyprotein [Vesivirus ferret badger/JX12/China/2012]
MASKAISPKFSKYFKVISVLKRARYTSTPGILFWEESCGFHVDFQSWHGAHEFLKLSSKLLAARPTGTSSRRVVSDLYQTMLSLNGVTGNADLTNEIGTIVRANGGLEEVHKADVTGNADFGIVYDWSIQGIDVTPSDFDKVIMMLVNGFSFSVKGAFLTNEQTFRAEMCPSCAIYDNCPVCKQDQINDDGTSKFPSIPDWTDQKISHGIMSLLSDGLDPMSDFDLSNIASHLRKAYSTSSHPANNDMSKEQIHWLINMAEAGLKRGQKLDFVPIQAARIKAREDWRSKLFNYNIPDLDKFLTNSKDSIANTAAYKVLFEKAACAKHYGVEWYNKALELMDRVTWKSTNDFLKVVVSSAIQHLRTFVIDNPDPITNLPKFIMMMKPLNLQMIIENHESTTEGWIVTITALAELYGFLDLAIELVPKIVGEIFNLLSTATQKCYSMVRDLFTATFKAESLDLTNPFWYALAAFIVYFVTGFLPNNAKMAAIKNTLVGANTLMSGILAIQKLSSMFASWSNESAMNELSAKVIALAELDNPTVTQDMDSVSNLQVLGEKLRDDLKIKSLDPTFQIYNVIIRNLMTTVENVISHCVKRKAIATQRVAPVAIILTGPPGCGKTTLAYELAKRLSSQKPSVLNLSIDHHDAYTGNEVCIIDEFDSNPKVDYANFVIDMVNTNPMLLNCDMIENKGKVFSSKYVIMTSNNETPVSSTSSRAPAFYRRVRIIDVDNPGVMDYKYSNPGQHVPNYLFNSNFSHLVMHMRGVGAYSKEHVVDPVGRNAKGLDAPRPMIVDADMIVAHMKRTYAQNAAIFKAESRPKIKVPTFGFVVEQAHTQTVMNILKAAQITYNGNFLLTEGNCMPTPQNSGYGSRVHVITPVEAENFPGKKFVVDRTSMLRNPHLAHIEGDNFRSALGVCMSDDDVRDMFYYIHGKSVNDRIQLDKLPANNYVVTVHTVYDMAWALSKHLSVVGKFQAIKALYDLLVTPDTLPVALRNWMDSTSFSKDHVVTQFILPGGTIILESCHGARMWATKDKIIRAGGVHSIHGPEGGLRFLGVGIRNIPWSEIFKEFLNLISILWSKIKGATAILAVLTLYLRRYRPTAESKGKNKAGRGAMRGVGKGVTLTDDEYDEWREYTFDKRNNMSVEEYLLLRNRAALGSDDQEAVKFRYWYTQRQLAAQDYDDVTVIGKGGVRNETIRTSMLKAPKKSRMADLDENPMSYFAEAEGKVQHASAIMPVTMADGHRVGYAIHIGHGVCISLKHVLEVGSYVLGQKAKDCKFDGELVHFKIDNYPQSAAPVAVGKPVKDPWSNAVSTEWKPQVNNTSVGKMYTALAFTNAHTNPGDCGLPYVDERGCIVGLHAGSGGSTAPAKKIIVPYVKRKMNRDTVKKYWYDEKPTISYKGLKCQETHDNRKMVSGTKLHVSPAHLDDYTECSHQPANLGSADDRNNISLTSIVVNNLQPYKEPTPGPPTNVLSRAKKMLIKTLEPFIPKSTEVLDMVTAFRKLNPDTSCGPYIGGRKKDHVEDGVIDKVMLDHLTERWTVASKGLAIPHEYALGLKDELRPVDKIKEAKRRLIWGCDVAVATVAAAAFKEVSDSIMAMHELGFIQVGINMDGPAIETLYKRLYAAGHERYCVDYSKWDSTQPPNVTRESLSILQHFSAEHPIVDSAVATLASPPIAVFNGVSFKTGGGLPSGMPLTSILNSLNHCLLVCCAIIESLESKGIDVNWNVYDTIDMFTYGDDGVYIVPRFIDSIMPSVFEHLKAYGLKPTRTDKSAKPIEPVPKGEPVEFLKRTFVRNQNGVRALLDRNSLLRQFYYIKGKNTMNWREPPTEIDVSSRSAQLWNVCLFASQHGPDFYSKVLELMNKAIVHEGLVIEPPSYMEAVLKYNSYFNGSDPSVIQMLDSDHTKIGQTVFVN